MSQNPARHAVNAANYRQRQARKMGIWFDALERIATGGGGTAAYVIARKALEETGHELPPNARSPVSQFDPEATRNLR